MNSSALEDHLRISVSCMKAVSEHMKELEKSANKNEQTSKDSKMSKKLQSESGKSISLISRVKVVFVKVGFLSVCICFTCDFKIVRIFRVKATVAKEQRMSFCF